MAAVFTILFALILIGFIFLAITFIRKRKITKIHKILLAFFALVILILLYKFAVEEVYPCWKFGGIYCNFTQSSYHSPLFPF